MTGCLEKVSDLSQTPSLEIKDQVTKPSLQMDYDAELRSDLFSVRGDLILLGDRTLAYLLLNATLFQEDKEQSSTKYLLMQIEPNRDYSFEISKNVKIPAGKYICTLEAKGPQGVLAEESRRISLAESERQPAIEQIFWPVAQDEKVFGKEVEEVWPKEERILPKEAQAATEELGDRASLVEETSNENLQSARAEHEAIAEEDVADEAAQDKVMIRDEPDESSALSESAAGKEDSSAMDGEDRGFASAGISLQTSSNLPEEAKDKFMGSITSKKYHLLDCRYALKIKPENCIYFQSMEDAKSQGYIPCKICNP
jgi:hypothetical protein